MPDRVCCPSKLDLDMVKMIFRGHVGPSLALVTTAGLVACGQGKATPQQSTSASAAAIAVAIAPAAPPDSGATSADLPADARVALDSGNALYRTKQYAAALVQYRLTAKRAPGDPTAYYGIYMVAEATKNRLLADTASAALTARGAMAPMPHPQPKSPPK